jgi:hypothetical protein
MSESLVRSRRLLGRLVVAMMERMKAEPLKFLLDHIERLAIERPEGLDHVGQILLRLIPGHSDEIERYGLEKQGFLRAGPAGPGFFTPTIGYRTAPAPSGGPS